MTNEFHTDEGVIKDGHFFAKGKKEGEPLADVEFSLHPGGPFGNFIDCVRSRKRENLNAEILEGHRSALLCHLGNISYQLGSGGSVQQGGRRAWATTRPWARRSRA